MNLLAEFSDVVLISSAFLVNLVSPFFFRAPMPALPLLYAILIAQRFLINLWMMRLLEVQVLRNNGQGWWSTVLLVLFCFLFPVLFFVFISLVQFFWQVFYVQFTTIYTTRT